MNRHRAVATAQTSPSVLDNRINGAYDSLPKPSVGGVIMFTTMPDKKEIQCVRLEWQRGRIKLAQQPQLHRGNLRRNAIGSLDHRSEQAKIRDGDHGSIHRRCVKGGQSHQGCFGITESDFNVVAFSKLLPCSGWLPDRRIIENDHFRLN